VGALPETLRDTLTLCIAAGLSHQAAADELGVPVGTLKTRVRLGLALVRRSMLDAQAPPGTDALFAPKSERGLGVVLVGKRSRE